MGKYSSFLIKEKPKKFNSNMGDDPMKLAPPPPTPDTTTRSPGKRWCVSGVVVMVLLVLLVGWCAYLTTEQHLYHKKSHNLIMDLQKLVREVRKEGIGKD